VQEQLQELSHINANRVFSIQTPPFSPPRDCYSFPHFFGFPQRQRWIPHICAGKTLPNHAERAQSSSFPPIFSSCAQFFSTKGGRRRQIHHRRWRNTLLFFTDATLATQGQLFRIVRIWCSTAHVSPNCRWSGLEFPAAELNREVEVHHGHRCQLVLGTIRIH
jgi:hypothetical protein